MPSQTIAFRPLKSKKFHNQLLVGHDLDLLEQLTRLQDDPLHGIFERLVVRRGIAALLLAGRCCVRDLFVFSANMAEPNNINSTLFAADIIG